MPQSKRNRSSKWKNNLSFTFSRVFFIIFFSVFVLHSVVDRLRRSTINFLSLFLHFRCECRFPFIEIITKEKAKTSATNGEKAIATSMQRSLANFYGTIETMQSLGWCRCRQIDCIGDHIFFFFNFSGAKISQSLSPCHITGASIFHSFSFARSN